MNRGKGRAIQRRTSRAIESHLQTVGWISRQKISRLPAEGEAFLFLSQVEIADGKRISQQYSRPRCPRGVEAPQSEIYPQDQFADGLAIFQPPMRFGCFRKGKYTTNSRLQPTALHSFACRSSASEDFFARFDEISEAAAGNSNRFGHQRGGKDRIRRATRPAVKGDVASSGNRVKISCECALANSIDDVVGALAVRQPFRLGGEIFPGVKNHMVGPCLPRRLALLFGRDCANHASAQML